MSIIKSAEEIKILRQGGKILASVLNDVAAAAGPGVVAIELDVLAEKLIRRAGGEPSFKNYKTDKNKTPFPASLCVSINNEVVHGIPTKDKILKEGDIVGLDLGMRYKGLYTDMAMTIPIGQISKMAQRLIETTRKSLDVGIGAIKEGAQINDIGFAIQKYVEARGFNVVKKLVGHGVGYRVHEWPEIPNYGMVGASPQLKRGMVLALEPMINNGDSDVVLSEDGWTWKTRDGSLSSHFEHTVVVTKSGAEILTKLL